MEFLACCGGVCGIREVEIAEGAIRNFYLQGERFNFCVIDCEDEDFFCKVNLLHVGWE